MTTVDTTETLYAAARAWRDDDPDPTTRDELDAVLGRAAAGDAEAAADLADRMAGLLEFGTAGLRGALGGLRLQRFDAAQGFHEHGLPLPGVPE